MATESASMEFEESDVIEIIPADEYDTQRAKLKSSVSWILTKAYGNTIPPDLKDPFYENAKGQLQVKPQLINLMTSSELYCQACSNMFSDSAFQWQDHSSIIQVLSRKGIYVEDCDTVITETILMHTAPFKVAAHLALIDALMKAYVSEIASIERVVQAVRRYASFSASSELPDSREQAVVFWINKTCTALAARGDLDIIQGESHQKVRIVSKSTPREPKTMPVVQDLMEDIGDGCCVAATIAFYLPDALPVTDICLNENVGIADSLYNLRLIRTFCERHLVLKCFHFTYEDLLYGKENLRENVVVFLAELFFLLEAAQKGNAQKDLPSEGSGQVTGRRLPTPNIPPVSGATKRSFQKAADDGHHHLEKISACPPALSSRQPLLQKRSSSRRSQSLSLPQERETIRRSVLAWQDDQDIRDRGSLNSNLLQNVSISWDADTIDDSDLDPVSSADLADFEVTGHLLSQRSNLTDPSHPEFMEVTSVTPGQPSTARSSHVSPSDRHEPLMPAKLRPAKEKINNHSKAEERGDRTPRKKVVSPTKPSKGKLSPPGSSHVPVGGGKVGIGSGSPRSSGSSMDETIVTPLASAEFVTVPSDDTITSSSDASVPTSTLQQQQNPQESQQQLQHSQQPQNLQESRLQHQQLQQQEAPQQQQQTRPVSRTGYEAFMIAPDSAEISVLSPRRTVRDTPHGDKPTVSYTLESNVHDSETARQAGLPVIGQSFGDTSLIGGDGVSISQHSGDAPAAGQRSGNLSAFGQNVPVMGQNMAVIGRVSGGVSTNGEAVHRNVASSREGSVASSRSSGDFSDHESHKIHQDHKARESLKHSPRQNVDLSKGHGQAQAQGQPQSGSSLAPKPGQLITDHLPGSSEGQKKPGTTSFAEIRRMKGVGKVENSGVVYMQQGQEQQSGDGGQTNLKSALTQRAEEKKPTVAHHPKETTWQQSIQRQAAQSSASTSRMDSSSPSNGDRPAAPELSQLRLKLEEKRREIERKKQRQEVQTAKMRQRLGKAAFMRVVSKKDEVGGRGVVLSNTPGLSAWGESSTGRTARNSPPPSHALIQERLGQVTRDEPLRPSTLSTISPASSNSTSASQSPSAGGRLFPRDGVLDSGRPRWFHGSDPEGETIKDMTDDGIPVSELSFSMMQSCPPDMAAETFGYSEERASPALRDGMMSSLQSKREMSQSPRRTPERRVSEGGDVYDPSLNKLNRSLTELQGEINRLSLHQQEQFRSSQNSPQPDSLRTEEEVPHSVPHPSFNPLTHLASASLVPGSSPPSSSSSHPHTATPPPIAPPPISQDDDTSGFFVSLGDDTPRRSKPSKPKLGKDREAVDRRKSGEGQLEGAESHLAMPLRGAEPHTATPLRGAEPHTATPLRGAEPQTTTPLYGTEFHNVPPPPGAEFQRVPPLHGDVAMAAGGEVGSNHSGSHHSLQSGSDESGGGVGFVLGQQSLDTTKDTEMQKKKERLMQQQMKRKEDQERKRLQKELETQRRQEQKMLKDEEQEKKKAEEKARREAIFQQYMQKKTEDDDRSPAATTVTRRDRSGNSHQPRPKSMFAKSRPTNSDMEDGRSARGAASHSSQEDLSSHASPTGSNAPLSPFRLNPNARGKIRKAVSCNQLTHNGNQGASTYRRPASPGPKLFVKPSSKSNRHIIINALSYCCLAGIVNTDMKNKVLEEIARSAAKHFLILFRDHSCQYRGLYSFDPDTEEAYKIVGIGPRQLTSPMVHRFYKYNSGGKSFTEVTSTKHLSVSIDAVVLQNVYWKSKPTAAAARR